MTIKDIAKLSGVGVSTVSRVLNDRPDVSEESRRRVLEVIAEHNYLPNNSARSLVRTKSDTVGLVVRGVQNPFYTDIIRAIEHKLDLAGYTMVMRQIASGDDEVKCGAVMEREKRLQGLIFLGGRSDYSPAELALLNVPFVCCTYTNAYGTLDPSKYSSVSIADEQEAYRAVMELAKKGHRRIGLLVLNSPMNIGADRLAGCLRALREVGVEQDPALVRCCAAAAVDGYTQTRLMMTMPDPPTAIVCCSEELCTGAVRACMDLSLVPGRDISLVSFDELITPLAPTAITSVFSPRRKMAKVAAERLLEMVANPANRTPRKDVVVTIIHEQHSIAQL